MRITCVSAILCLILSLSEGRRYHSRRRPTVRPVVLKKVPHIDPPLKRVSHVHKHGAHIEPPLKRVPHVHKHGAHIDPLLKRMPNVKTIGKDVIKPGIVKPIVAVKTDLVKSSIVSECPPRDVCATHFIPDRCREQTFIRVNGRVCPGCDRDICAGGRRLDIGSRINPIDQFLDTLTGRGNVDLTGPAPRLFEVVPDTNGVSLGRPPLVEAGSVRFGPNSPVPSRPVQIIPSSGNVQVVPAGVLNGRGFGQTGGRDIRIIPSSGAVPNVPLLQPTGAQFPGNPTQGLTPQLGQFGQPQIPTSGVVPQIGQFPQNGPIELALPPQLQNQPGQGIPTIPGGIGNIPTIPGGIGNIPTIPGGIGNIPTVPGGIGNNGVQFLGSSGVQGGNVNPFQRISGEPLSGRFQDGFSRDNLDLFRDVSSLNQNNEQFPAVPPGGANSWATSG